MAAARFWHFLKAIGPGKSPTRIVCVDTETYGVPHGDWSGQQRHKFRLGWVSLDILSRGDRVSSVHQPLHSPGDFWRFLSTAASSRQSTWVFAHGLGFDLTILGFWRLLETGEYLLADRGPVASDTRTPTGDPAKVWRGLFVDADPPTIIVARCGGHTVRFVDSRNYWNVSLATLGDWLGLPKQQMPDPEANDIVWSSYCRRDLDILRKAVIGLIDATRELDLGGLKTTMAAQAWAGFRRRLQPREVLIHMDERATALERAAYYGGRNQCHYVGDVLDVTEGGPVQHKERISAEPATPTGPVYEVDVNGFYPHIMSVIRVPVRLIRCGSATVDGIRRDMESGMGCVARVMVNSPSQTYPVRIDGKTCFARGNFRTDLCGAELMHALSCGHVITVFFASLYTLGQPLQRFADLMLEVRQRAKAIGSAFGANTAKLLANALYGKFAQRSHLWEAAPTVASPIPWGHWWSKVEGTHIPVCYRSLGWHTQVAAERGEHADSFPAISAYVTSHGRWVMERLRLLAGQANVYYVDTDCLHVNQHGLDAIEAAGMLSHGTPGMLSIRHWGTTATYCGLKHYAVGDKSVIGGISRKAKQIGPGLYEQPQFPNLRSSLNSQPDGSVLIKMIKKHVADRHPRGCVGPDGWVIPMTLGGVEE